MVSTFHQSGLLKPPGGILLVLRTGVDSGSGVANGDDLEEELCDEFEEMGLGGGGGTTTPGHPISSPVRGLTEIKKGSILLKLLSFYFCFLSSGFI